MTPTPLTTDTAAGVIARFLKARGVDRIFALCGGHIMPMWMRADAEGIRIIDVRDERAAVYMAHAHSELTGQLGVVLATAGPGVTNAMTGIANAHVARAPILVLSGLPPRPQENRGAPCPRRPSHCRSLTKQCRVRLVRLASLARCIWISPPTRCAPKCPRHCRCKSTSRRRRGDHCYRTMTM